MTTQDQLLGERAGLAGSGTRRPRVGRSTLRAIYIIWYRDLVRYVRDRARLEFVCHHIFHPARGSPRRTDVY